MTENNTDTATPDDQQGDETEPQQEEGPQAEVQVDETEQPEPGAPEHSNGNREAAKYRRLLREVEAERDRLTQHLAESRVSTLEAHGRSAWILPGAIRDVFPDVNAVFGEDGTIDAEAYDAQFNQVRKERPYLFEQYVIPNAGRVPESKHIEPGFEAAFKPKK